MLRTIRGIWSLGVVIALASCSLQPEPIGGREHLELDRNALQNAFSNQEPISSYPLTLEEAFVRALKYNLQYQTSLMQEGVALSLFRKDQHALLPSLQVRGSSTARDNPDVAVNSLLLGEPTTVRDNSFTLSWAALDMGAAYLRAKQDADRYLIAQEQRRRVWQRIFADVQGAWYAATTAREVKVMADEVEQMASQALERLDITDKERLRDPLESLRYRKTLMTTLSAVQQLRDEMELSESYLARLINLMPGEKVALSPLGMEKEVRADYDIDALETLALSLHPNLRERNYQNRIDVHETRASLLSIFPNLSLSWSAKESSDERKEFRSWSEAGWALSLNLFGLAQIPAINDLADRQEQLNAKRLEYLSWATILGVRLATQQYEDAIRSYQKAEALYSVDMEYYEKIKQAALAGGVDSLSVVQGGSEALRSLLSYHQRFHQVHMARTRLYFSAGLDFLPQKVVSTEISLLAKEVASRDKLNYGLMTGSVPIESVIPPPIYFGLHGEPFVGELVAGYPLRELDVADNSVVRYQWQRRGKRHLPGFPFLVWDDIPGATDSAYRLSEQDLGDSIRLTARYMRENGVETDVISVISDSVSLAPGMDGVRTGLLVLHGEPIVDEVLKGEFASDFDIGAVSAVQYQWQRKEGVFFSMWQDIPQENSMSYRVRAQDIGLPLRLMVLYVDAEGNRLETASPPTDWVYVAGEQEPPKVHAPPGEIFVLHGVPVVDEVMSASFAGAFDLDDASEVQYQWQRQEGLFFPMWRDISEATNFSYRVRKQDLGAPLRFAMRYVDAEGNEREAVSDPSMRVVDEMPVKEVDPHDIPVTSDAVPSEPVDVEGSEQEDVSDPGMPVVDEVPVKEVDPHDIPVTSDAVPSEPVDVEGSEREDVADPSADVGLLVLHGEPIVGEVLRGESKFDVGAASTLQYQWQRREGVFFHVWEDIPQATGISYQVQERDMGFPLRLVVRYVDAEGYRLETASPPTNWVYTAPSVEVSAPPAEVSEPPVEVSEREPPADFRASCRGFRASCREDFRASCRGFRASCREDFRASCTGFYASCRDFCVAWSPGRGRSYVRQFCGCLRSG